MKTFWISIVFLVFVIGNSFAQFPDDQVGHLDAESVEITGNLTADTNTLFVDEINHKVGIGTTEPTKKLTISSDVSSEAGMEFIDTSATSPGNTKFYTAYGNFYLSPSSGLTRFFQSGISHALELYDGATKNIRLATNGVSYFLGGNIGIGTASPATQLQIGSLTSTADQFISMLTEGGDVGYLSSGLKLRLHTNDYGWDILSANRASSQAGLDIIRHNNSAAGVSAFFINLTTGNVGIGTATPAYTLDITGSARVTAKVIKPPLTFSPVLASDEIPSTSAKVKLYNGVTSPLVLGSASGEVIDTAGAVDGQEITVYNAGYVNGHHVTLSVRSTSNTWSKVISKDGANIVLKYEMITGMVYMQSASFTFDATTGYWIQM